MNSSFCCETELPCAASRWLRRSSLLAVHVDQSSGVPRVGPGPHLPPLVALAKPGHDQRGIQALAAVHRRADRGRAWYSAKNFALHLAENCRRLKERPGTSGSGGAVSIHRTSMLARAVKVHDCRAHRRTPPPPFSSLIRQGTPSHSRLIGGGQWLLESSPCAGLRTYTSPAQLLSITERMASLITS